MRPQAPLDIVDSLAQLAANAEPPALDDAAARRMIDAAIAAPPPARSPAPPRRSFAWPLATAAFAVLALYLLVTRPTRVEPTAEPLRVTLPTGDRLVGTAGAQFDVLELAPTSRRLRVTTGEIVFDVARAARGQHFEVVTSHATVIATGTVFSVAADAGATRVHVFEGSVAIDHDGRRDALSAGSSWSSDAAGSFSASILAAGESFAAERAAPPTAADPVPTAAAATIPTPPVAAPTDATRPGAPPSPAPPAAAATSPPPIAGTAPTVAAATASARPASPPSPASPAAAVPAPPSTPAAAATASAPPASPPSPGSPAGTATVPARTAAPADAATDSARPASAPSAASPAGPGLVPARPAPAVTAPTKIGAAPGSDLAPTAPKLEIASIAEARADVAAGRYDAALAKAAAPMRDAESGAWELVRGDALRALRRPAEAAVAFETAARLLTGAARVEAAYSAAYLRLHELRDAARALADLAGTDEVGSPFEERATVLRVDALMALGKKHEAAAIAGRYLDRFPKGGSAKLMRALLTSVK